VTLDSTAQQNSMSQIHLTSRFRIKYTILTLAFFLPLIWSFAKVRNVYPVTSWNVMTRGGEFGKGYTYFVLRGESVSGDLIDLPAVKLTDAMRSRTWGLVAATANNDSLKLRSPHPKNVALLAAGGNVESLPDGVLMKELLKSWGEIFNERHPPSSPDHLRALQIDCYRWPGGQYSNYSEFVQSWRQEL